MSCQPCLPVARRRKRTNNMAAEEEIVPDWSTVNVSSMDATEYLRLVVSEASCLPNVFTAASNNNNNNNNNNNDNNNDNKNDDDDDDDNPHKDRDQFADADESMDGETHEEGSLSLLLCSQTRKTINNQSSPPPPRPGSSNNSKQHMNQNNKNHTKKHRNLSSSSSVVHGSAAAAQYLVSSQTELAPPPTAEHLPASGKVWADRSLDAFSRLRVYLEQVKHHAGPAVEKKIGVPPMKDRAAWHEFCVGKEDAEGNAGAYYDDDDDDDDNDAEQGDNEKKDDRNNTMKEEDCESAHQEEEEEEVPAWKQGLLENTNEHGFYWPTTSLLLQMDQVMVRRVLSHMTYYVCEGWALTAARSAWIYALAARLDRSIHRDDAVVLYKLLKRLTAIRSHLTPTSQELPRANLLILIVGVYFEQGGGYASTMELRGF